MKLTISLSLYTLATSLNQQSDQWNTTSHVNEKLCVQWWVAKFKLFQALFKYISLISTILKSCELDKMCNILSNTATRHQEPTKFGMLSNGKLAMNPQSNQPVTHCT